MTKSRILIVDDEPLYLRTTGELLRREGYDCVCLSDAREAMRLLREESFELVLSDLNMPGNVRLEFLHDHSEHRPGIPLIVVTGVPSLPTAIESLRLGISDYLLKPVKFEDLLASVKRVLQRVALHPPPPVRRNLTGKELATLYPRIVGSSPAMRNLLDVVHRVAATDANILLTGESGTGKEVIAKTIHEQSHRLRGAFQVIDCTAVPENLFESLLFGHKKGSFTGAFSDQEGLLKQCNGGTAFFDEIGELPLPLQAKLLRAVQEQNFYPVGSHTPVQVDTRFICATNRDLRMEVQSGRFRQDLFYRLSVIHIELPPLRERGDDVWLLARHFLQQLQQRHPQIEGFTDAALEAMRSYRWPGNIRELRNVIERSMALATGNLIDVRDLPDMLRLGGSAGLSQERQIPRQGSVLANSLQGRSAELANTLTGASREEMLKVAEHHYLMNLLQTHGGNVSEAARQAGVSRQGLHKLLRQHNINAGDFRP